MRNAIVASAILALGFPAPATLSSAAVKTLAIWPTLNLNTKAKAWT